MERLIVTWGERYTTTDVWIALGVLLALCVAYWLALGLILSRQAMSTQYTVKLKTGETFIAHKTTKDWAGDGFFNFYYTIDAATWCESGTRVKIPRHNLAWVTLKKLPVK